MKNVIVNIVNFKPSPVTYTVMLRLVGSTMLPTGAYRLENVTTPQVVFQNLSPNLYEVCVILNSPSGSLDGPWHEVYEYSCPVVSNIVIDTITATGAAMSCTLGNGVTEIKYRLNYGSWVSLNGSSTTLTGLTGGRNYKLEIKAKCSETEYSRVVSKSFTTTSASPSMTICKLGEYCINNTLVRNGLRLTINGGISVGEQYSVYYLGVLIASFTPGISDTLTDIINGLNAQLNGYDVEVNNSDGYAALSFNSTFYNLANTAVVYPTCTDTVLLDRFAVSIEP